MKIKVKYTHAHNFCVLKFTYPIRRKHWWSIKPDCNWVLIKAKSYNHAKIKAKRWYKPERHNYWLSSVQFFGGINDPSFNRYYYHWKRRPFRNIVKFIENIKKCLH